MYIFYILKIKYNTNNMNTISLFENNTSNPFENSTSHYQTEFIHIRIQQRNNRQSLTTVQGLSDDYDLKKIVKAFKREFACNGCVINHNEYGEVIQLQGDQRENVSKFLLLAKMSPEELIKVHGG